MYICGLNECAFYSYLFLEMTRLRFDILELIVALLVGVILGIFATVSFSSPSSEARVSGGSGFFENPSSQAGSNPVGVGSPPQPTSTFIENLAQGGWASKPTENGALERARPPILIISAYCPCEKCCGKFADGITASGHIIQPGDRFVAAPPEIPFGTYLSIEGYAEGFPVEVRDRGGAIKGNRLDVFFGGENGHQEALVWGVREMRFKQ